MTSGTFSSTNSVASGLNVTSVVSMIITACLGSESTTTNFKSPSPKPTTSSSKSLKKSSKGVCSELFLLAGLPSDTISPLITALPCRPCLKISGEARIMIPFLAGASETFFAGLTSAFLTFTISPSPERAFLLIRPSILIILWPISAGYALSTTETVFLSPSISTTSPGRTPSRCMNWESILTSPLLTSSCTASAILSFTSFFSSGMIWKYPWY